MSSDQVVGESMSQEGSQSLHQQQNYEVIQEEMNGNQRQDSKRSSPSQEL